ncbi:MAG TPA: MFS transporter [Planctomycetota bacterium]|jgi:MFS family permease
MSENAAANAAPDRPWWTYLNSYHWFVFIMAIFGWLFDTMDGQIFVASRNIAVQSLLPPGVDAKPYSGYVTMMFILGWAIGGLLFGKMGDRWGRAKTMGLTILVYAGFTGLSALSQNWWQFGIFRFLTGMGVGGEFAAGASLVAESMPEKARAKALGMVQAFSAIGNVIGATLFGVVESRWGWQVLYLVGAFPALLAVLAFTRLREPEKWIVARDAMRKAKAAGEDTSKHLGSIADLLSPRWRRNTIVGLLLGIAGVLGLWGVGFFSPELIEASLPLMSSETQAKMRAVMNAKDETEFKTAIQHFQDDDNAYKTLVSTRIKPPISADEAFKTPLSVEQATQVAVILKASENSSDNAAATGFTPETVLKIGAIAGATLKPAGIFDLLAGDDATRIARRFKDTISALKEDDRAYLGLVTKWLKPVDRVADKIALGSPDSGDAASIKAECEIALKTPLDAAQKAQTEIRLKEAQARLDKATAVQKERTKAFTTPLQQTQKAQISVLLDKALNSKEMTSLKSWGLIVQQIGAFFGIMVYSFFATRFGRRPAFLFAFGIGWISVWTTFYFFNDKSHIWFLFPLLGFGTLAPFGGYAMYFPELFPTRLRNTGTSFCYNVGRFVAALGPGALGLLAGLWEAEHGAQSFRMAALAVSCSYIIGIVALIWAPETKDQPLPEDIVPAGVPPVGEEVSVAH